MGVQRTVTFPAGEPGWADVAVKLAAVGAVPAVRMIDGLPAFPDEQPEAGWSELRLGFPAGMVTVSRTPAGWRCVVWGTDDPNLLAAQNVCAWACAAAGGGLVSTDAGPQSAADFAAASGVATAPPGG